MEAVGDDRKVPGKEGSNDAGPGSNVQGSGASGVTIWKQELSGDRGDSQGPDGILPSGGTPDNRDDG